MKVFGSARTNAEKNFMPDDWALERAREIRQWISRHFCIWWSPSDEKRVEEMIAEAIAAELRKERERAEAAEARAAALEKQVNDLLGNEVRTAEAEIRAAALEAALREACPEDSASTRVSTARGVAVITVGANPCTMAIASGHMHAGRSASTEVNDDPR
jgi:hypothetical protein